MINKNKIEIGVIALCFCFWVQNNRWCTNKGKGQALWELVGKKPWRKDISHC